MGIFNWNTMHIFDPQYIKDNIKLSMFCDFRIIQFYRKFTKLEPHQMAGLEY